MPVMDGFAFVERLKKFPAYAEKLVVFLNTESTADKKERGGELGVSGWMIKPVSRSPACKLSIFFQSADAVGRYLPGLRIPG